MNYWVHISSAFRCAVSDNVLSVDVSDREITFTFRDGSGKRETVIDADVFEEFIVQALRDTKTLKKG